jgi:hypothetical protein
MGNSWLVTLRVQVDSDIVTKEEESGITHQDPGMDIVNTFIKGNLFNEDLMKEMAKEGISEVQVMQLLGEMEMLDESGEGIWGEEETQPMEYLPSEILPSVHELANEMQQDREEGFLILDMDEGKMERVTDREEEKQEEQGCKD